MQAVGSFFGGGSGSALNNARMFVRLKPMVSGKDDRSDSAGDSYHTIAAQAFEDSGRRLFLVPGQDIRVGGGPRRRSINTP